MSKPRNDEDAPKSAIELAMERLKSKDRTEGRAETAPLTEAQKGKISEIRKDFEAKTAQLEIMTRSHREATWDKPEERLKVEEHAQIDRRRLEEDRDSKIARVRENR